MKLSRSIALLSLTLFVGGAMAASIPSWLDDGIANWNEKHPGNQVEFMDIKDSYVWYTMTKSGATERNEIRARMYAVVEAHGYKTTSDEELVTTGKPPTPVEPYKKKKCWSRNFVKTVDLGQQRMLTTMLCEDGTNWYPGFRILQ